MFIAPLKKRVRSSVGSSKTGTQTTVASDKSMSLEFHRELITNHLLKMGLLASEIDGIYPTTSENYIGGTDFIIILPGLKDSAQFHVTLVAAREQLFPGKQSKNLTWGVKESYVVYDSGFPRREVFGRFYPRYTQCKIWQLSELNAFMK